MRNPTSRPAVSLLAVLVAACCLASVGPAAASSESASPTAWTAPASPHGGELTAVSCVSATRCIAVGKYYGGRLALIEQWDGSRWTVMPSPSPGAESSLAGVSCTSATRCVAVGIFYASKRLHALIETWNGTSWRYNPRIGDANALFGVSCASASSCVAVGVAGDGNHAAAEMWDGTHWSVASLPDTPDGSAAGFLGVSCVSTAHCVAAGFLTLRGAWPEALVETWDGAGWSIAPTPASSNELLEAVSCSSAASCFAVGRAGGGDGRGPTVIEQWNGTAWTVLPTPKPAGPYYAEDLTGVSCVSATSCVAVGFARNTTVLDSEVLRTLVESWDGTRWSVTPTPQPGPKVYSSLDAVSCTPEHCAAVGYTFPTGFAAQSLGLSGIVAPRTVKVSWTATENARLLRIAAYLHLSPARVQKAAVYGTAYLVGLSGGPPTPTLLPRVGTGATYSTVWAPSQLGVLDSVRVKFALGSVGATRLSVYLLSYLLALGGH